MVFHQIFYVSYANIIVREVLQKKISAYKCYGTCLVSKFSSVNASNNNHKNHSSMRQSLSGPALCATRGIDICLL